MISECRYIAEELKTHHTVCRSLFLRRTLPFGFQSDCTVSVVKSLPPKDALTVGDVRADPPHRHPKSPDPDRQLSHP